MNSIGGGAVGSDHKLSPEQYRLMMFREEVVLKERARGQSWAKIDRRHTRKPHVNLDGEPCPCTGMTHPERIWRRAVAREDNINWRRAEAIKLEEQRLDELQDGIWLKALGGDARSVEVALKVLERRARMFGLDFADEISGRLVEVEQQKVRLMATALVKALQETGASAEQRRAATAAFFSELRANSEVTDDGVHSITSVPIPLKKQRLEPRDKDLL